MLVVEPSDVALFLDCTTILGRVESDPVSRTIVSPFRATTHLAASQNSQANIGPFAKGDRICMHIAVL